MIKKILQKIIPFRIISKRDKDHLASLENQLKSFEKTFRRYSADALLDFQHLDDPSGFTQAEIPLRSVLIVEPNPYHGLLLPGITRYFQEAGYAVDLLLRHENITYSSFVLYPKKNMPRLFSAGADMMDYCLTLPKIGAYDFIFYSTYVRPEQPLPSPAFPNAGLPLQKPRIQTLYLSHYPHDLKKNDPNRGFSITGRPGLPLLSPHYFGEVPSEAGNSLKFLSVGYYIGSGRAQAQMWKAAEAIAEAGGFLDIVDQGKIDVPPSLKEYVCIHQGLSFPELCSLIIQCRAFLNTFDEKENAHYLTGVTSSLRYMMLGFNKPAVIPEIFGKAFGFHPQHYYPYKNFTQLSAVLHTACQDKTLYQQKKEALDALSKLLYAESLANVKDILSQLEASRA